MTPDLPPMEFVGSKRPFQWFRHCPRCGLPLASPPDRPCLQCGACGFTYFFNPACAAGAFIADARGHVLLLRRSREPALGKLALPGGFIDCGETAEAALRREILEEVGLEVGALVFLCSQTNEYAYRGVVYPVVDLFFATTAPPGQAARALDGASAVCWEAPGTLDPDALAFPSIRRALTVYGSRISPSGAD